MSANPLGITDTILRDAHQSLLATRMSTGSMFAHL
jgi:pyruvate/oxaloacetate carboxyltransferase